ncbi:MAG: hypothetical protein M3N95_02575 [Actinomycetota bacterium]|nr:hypothetical protein [Actinomycetota bacterium]
MTRIRGAVVALNGQQCSWIAGSARAILADHQSNGFVPAALRELLTELHDAALESRAEAELLARAALASSANTSANTSAKAALSPAQTSADRQLALNAKQAALAIGISERAVRQAAIDGRIKAHKSGDGSTWEFDAEDAERYRELPRRGPKPRNAHGYSA